MINLVEKLKNAPKGTKLYSTINGEVEFHSIEDGESFPIIVRCISNNKISSFNPYGQFYNIYDEAECVLFPSKENRDWNTFHVESPKFDISELKPFDKVLVRDSEEDVWKCTLFSHCNEDTAPWRFSTAGSSYRCCIPYNDETKHLAGTTDPYPEYYKTW